MPCTITNIKDSDNSGGWGGEVMEKKIFKKTDINDEYVIFLDS